MKLRIGGLKVNLEELEENEKKKIKVVIGNKKKELIEEETKDNKLINMEELKYYNGIGGFSNDGNEYIIEVSKEKRPQRAWANIIANDKFGTVITDNFGGYTWDSNSRLKRITRWSNNPITDTPSEFIYINENDKLWSVGNRLKTNQNYYVIHGIGYSIFKQLENNILNEVLTFVPINSKTKINKIHLKNLLREKRKINIYYGVNLVMGEDEAKTVGNIVTEKVGNKIICRNLCKDEFEDSVVIKSNKLILEYTNNKNEFMNDKIETQGISIDGRESISNGNFVGLKFELELDEFEETDIIVSLSTEEIDYIEKVDEELDNVKKFWNEKTSVLKIKTPSDETNILLNSWIIYQTLSSRLYARSGFYQSGGAVGFRDQLQDCLGMKFIDSNLLKNQIIKCCKHQFIEGDVLHWWHEETDRGIRTRFSDDLLWLPYSIIEYTDFTGDYEFLKTEVEFLEGEKLQENDDEKYDLYKTGDNKESVFKHAIKAIEKSINFGENGLPKIGSGDWNDGFSTVGNKGKGESVWLGFFLYDILNRFNKILDFMGEEEYKKRYDFIKKELKKSLNNNAWDGLWFRRAYTDNR
ncbi:MAG: hypothetical protein IKG42_07035 [Clostridia bacterium]|nr:hypothetical protein [Clostridia bacterium]